MWLAGVTHEVSAKLREIEAQQATGEAINVYDQKYREVSGGGRPELFAKGEPDAVVGHGQPITRPADTQRLVPETELVSVYGLTRQGRLERLGYTGGNDATDNGIEAANPLNLPQAKNWAGGCASLGPVLITADEYDDS
ncbi:MAG: fumarylacetoacetate hydrolase family protein, partial [Candidatus Latescibacteria bacterium]|nr:fumarylacetoacetate hydrolase family protein [Candidatus Latescibacterota bacterium]